jgi:hypothetical protein
VTLGEVRQRVDGRTEQPAPDVGQSAIVLNASKEGFAALLKFQLASLLKVTQSLRVEAMLILTNPQVFVWSAPVERILAKIA